MLLSFLHSNHIEAGVDEAGRGCLAGPVVAAAVILPLSFKSNLIDDSKKLSHSQRLICKKEIEDQAIAFAIGICSPLEIDNVNILQASFLAMHKALDKLRPKPSFILVDGNKFKPYKNIPFECIIKGDGKMMSIAAASILAKCYRDNLMEKLHLKFPEYNWMQNKGYPTLMHRKKILEIGATIHHRKTFSVQIDAQLKLF